MDLWILFANCVMILNTKMKWSEVLNRRVICSVDNAIINQRHLQNIYIAEEVEHVSLHETIHSS
jgi:hypothetical protein